MVLGYIHTFGGGTPLNEVMDQIQTYRDSNVHLNGFFIDQVNTPINLTYYGDIYNYIKGLSSSYQVVGNPGTPFLNGVAPSDFLSVADQMVIFEGQHFNSDPFGIGFNNYPYGLELVVHRRLPPRQIRQHRLRRPHGRRHDKRSGEGL